ncbi:DUF4286 family protein [soil metagenome]
MIIYNVTVNIEESVHEEWLAWMKNFHVPEVMRSGKFTSSSILRVIGDEDSGGKTYCIQYSCNSMSDFKTYEHEHAQALRAEHTAKFKDKFVAFRTLLETVD